MIRSDRGIWQRNNQTLGKRRRLECTCEVQQDRLEFLVLKNYQGRLTISSAMNRNAGAQMFQPMREFATKISIRVWIWSITETSDNLSTTSWLHRVRVSGRYD